MRKNKIFGLWKIVIFGIAIFILLLIWIFIIGISSKQPGAFFNKGHNAIWISHEWVGSQKTDSEIQDLVKILKKYQIDTVFVHSGPILSDGSVDPQKYKYAVDFIVKAKRFSGDIQYQAWLGQIRNKIDLSDKNVRHNIAVQAMVQTQMIGFDGVHFDIEPVWDEDADFIEVLKETRGILPAEKNISVALTEFIPSSLVWLTKNFYEFKNYNSEKNYKNVAKYADQIVVMAYDTGINSEWLYRWLVKEQTIWLSNLLEGKELFIGIPAYDDEKEGFNPKIENLENGLKGIISGLNNFRSDEENFAGAAIYPYWEVTEKEWEIYQNLWL